MTASRIGLALAGALLLTVPQAAAQDYPSKAITFIVPYATGGSSDLLARVVADRMSNTIGDAVVVENVTGAGGRVGMKVVADAEPDGYTIGLSALGSTAIAVAIDNDLEYDPIADFTPIATLASYSSFLLAKPDLPVNNLPELIEYATQHPGELSYGSAGIGSSSHLIGEMLKQASGMDIVHIPYGGGGAGVTDILGGHIPLHILSIAGSEEYVRTGQLKALAIFGNEVHPDFPDVRPMSETLPDMKPPLTWFGIVGPAGVPSDIVDKLHAEAVAALQSPELQEQISGWGLQMLEGGPDELIGMMTQDIETMRAVVEAAGIEVE